LRHRWFNELLKACGALKAVRTLNQRAPRMVKRRNSPYASHDRKRKGRAAINCAPTILPPKTWGDPAHRRSVARWAAFGRYQI
jgi:hypothetical protein